MLENLSTWTKYELVAFENRRKDGDTQYCTTIIRASMPATIARGGPEPTPVEASFRYVVSRTTEGHTRVRLDSEQENAISSWRDIETGEIEGAP
jgi:hypothetical protein